MDNLMFPHLFSPIKIGPVEISNRVMHSAHGTGSEDGMGFIVDRSVGYYVARARGGMGLILFGDVNIESGETVSVSMGKDIYVPKLRDFTDEIHFWGAKIFAHLHYSGSDPIFQVWKFQAGVQTEAIPTVSGESPEPGMAAREMTIAEIEKIQDTYAMAARRAKTAGFDGVSINAGFGFLPAQFLSSKANKRKDKYGGDVAGRARFLTELIHKIHAKTSPDFPVLLKLSGDELRPDGLSLDDTVAAAPVLEKEGLAAFQIAGGTQSMNDQHRVLPPMGQAPFGCYVPFATAVKKVVKIPVITGTRINDPQMAEEIIRDGKADMVALARASMADPEWAKKAREGRVEDINKCIYCNRCIGAIWPAYLHHLRCSVNPSVYKEREHRITPAPVQKRVMVIGGGPGGMEAARVAALRGHEVTLYEKSKQLGGQLLLAAKAPHKDEINNFTRYLTTQLTKMHVPVKLGKEVTAEMVNKIAPDVVIVATGARPLLPNIPGINGENVMGAWDIFNGITKVGKRVVIAGGGMVGCEVAELLVTNGKEVTIVEMLDDIAIDVEWSNRKYLMERFAKLPITILTKTKVEAIEKGAVRVTDSAGNKKEIPADTVIIALGSSPENKLTAELRGKVKNIYTIGDARRPSRILEAVHDAAYIAREI